MSILPTVARPAHVDPTLVVDFDFMEPGAAGSDPFIAWTRLHGLPPLVWTPRNGGHWLATRGADIPKILSDHERFSSQRAFIGMQRAQRLSPLEQDPPEHGPLRKALIPGFLPPAVKHWADEARALAVELIEGLKPQGRCEFVHDFAQQLPIIVFLKMMDLPLQDRTRLLDWVNTGLRTTDPDARRTAQQCLHQYVVELVDRRMREPGNDLLSQAIHADLGDGRRMTHEQALGTARTLLGGGLDTVASMLGWIALYLAQNPDHRRLLADDPKKYPKAIDEFMRRFAIANIARVVREDMEYEGAQLKAGEQILLASCIHGLDERSFPCPMNVDLARVDAYKHSTLSHGVHRCIGAPLAQQELRIFLQEWLARIPDFAIDPDDPPVMVTGVVHGLSRLPLRWAAAR